MQKSMYTYRREWLYNAWGEGRRCDNWKRQQTKTKRKEYRIEAGERNIKTIEKKKGRNRRAIQQMKEVQWEAEGEGVFLYFFCFFDASIAACVADAAPPWIQFSA